MPGAAVVADQLVKPPGLDLITRGGEGFLSGLAAALKNIFVVAHKAHILAFGAGAQFRTHVAGIHIHIRRHIFLTLLTHLLFRLGRHHRT